MANDAMTWAQEGAQRMVETLRGVKLFALTQKQLAGCDTSKYMALLTWEDAGDAGYGYRRSIPTDLSPFDHVSMDEIKALTPSDEGRRKAEADEAARAELHARRLRSVPRGVDLDPRQCALRSDGVILLPRTWRAAVALPRTRSRAHTPRRRRAGTRARARAPSREPAEPEPPRRRLDNLRSSFRRWLDDHGAWPSRAWDAVDVEIERERQRARDEGWVV